MADPLRVVITGQDKLDHMLGVYSSRLRRPFHKTDAERRAIVYVNNESMRQITHGQHGDYRRLSPDYARWKNRNHPSRPLLVITGKTVRSITDDHSPDFYHTVTDAGRTLTMGSKNEIAAYHQKGGKHLPARPLFVMTRRAAERLAEIIAEALPKGIK